MIYFHYRRRKFFLKIVDSVIIYGVHVCFYNINDDVLNEYNILCKLLNQNMKGNLVIYQIWYIVTQNACVQYVYLNAEGSLKYNVFGQCGNGNSMAQLYYDLHMTGKLILNIIS